MQFFLGSDPSVRFFSKKKEGGRLVAQAAADTMNVIVFFLFLTKMQSKTRLKAYFFIKNIKPFDRNKIQE